MSNELLIAAAVVGGVALGMNEAVAKSVRKAGGVTAAAWKSGQDRFSKTEPTLTVTETVTNVAKRS